MSDVGDEDQATAKPLVALTLAYLGLPYGLFAFGWLQWPLAVLLVSVLLWALWHVHAALPACAPVRGNRVSALLAFLVVVAWLQLSGSGGHGYQNIDYVAHNGRLQELIDYAWPLRYGEGRALVFYVGYYLPAAAVGKLFGLSVAYQCLYVWTLAGAWLACLWLASLSQMRNLPLVALLLVFFGGWDLAGYLYQTTKPWREALQVVLDAAHFQVDFWAAEKLPVSIGAYLSNTFQLYWSPHQVIAGWLVAALLFALYRQQQYRLFGVVYALYALWAPLLLLATAPLVALLCCSGGVRSLRAACSKENLLVGGIVAAIFGSYYLGGSALQNQADWLWNMFDVRASLPVLFAFFFLGWGIYALCLWPLAADRTWRRFVPLLLLALLCLPWYRYGEWADLMCRGSAPLMFLLLLCVLRSLAVLHEQRRYLLLGVSCLLLVPGSLSAVRHLHQSVTYYHTSQPFGLRSVDSPTAAEYVGPDNSFFFRYLAR